MPSTREIRRRIRGVKNIKQVTRAMNMIAAARLRRAQGKAESARPYADRISEILQDVQAGGNGAQHPFLQQREARRVALVLITSDRGLCGGFNAAMIREAGCFVRSQSAPVSLITVGKKGRDYFRGHGISSDCYFPQPSRDVRLEELGQISKHIIGQYTAGKHDRVYLGYSRFVSAMKSVPTIAQLLPLERASAEAKRERASYQFEPVADALLNTLLPQYVEVLIYRALVESLAAEQAARMIAMKSATDSAEEMISALTREYNRVRQNSITSQILEVVSGAEALESAH
jgi:F-type H+-transporting ATPase subunit gamma